MIYGWRLTIETNGAVEFPTNFKLLPHEGGPILKRKNLKALSVTIAISLLTILCVNVYADPWIMPGSVDITDATEPEDYIPEIKTITSYDEYGMPRD